MLACLVALSVLAGGVAFTGTTAAEEHHGLTAGDGAGGNASALIAGFDDQLPDGDASDDDTLRVEATNESLPSDFQGRTTSVRWRRHPRRRTGPRGGRHR
ncbi:hypothetical protein [Natronomonas sp.]|uniref:hypothetical protein n=1 Tax=Natronomonas sp. TaxID=2184060 RepID=UPI003FA5EE57